VRIRTALAGAAVILLGCGSPTPNQAQYEVDVRIECPKGVRLTNPRVYAFDSTVQVKKEPGDWEVTGPAGGKYAAEFVCGDKHYVKSGTINAGPAETKVTFKP